MDGGTCPLTEMRERILKHFSRTIGDLLTLSAVERRGEFVADFQRADEGLHLGGIAQNGLTIRNHALHRLRLHRQ